MDNQDTPVSIFYYIDTRIRYTWQSSANAVDKAVLIDVMDEWNAGDTNSGQFIYQRPVLYRFICNRKLDYINVIQRIQSILIIMFVTSLILHSIKIFLNFENVLIQENLAILYLHYLSIYTMSLCFYYEYSFVIGSNQDTPETLFVNNTGKYVWLSSHHTTWFSNYAFFVRPTGFAGENHGWPAVSIAYQRPILYRGYKAFKSSCL